MALVVEDGTVVAGADSYISVADADTYFTNLGNSAWTGADSVKEAALRKATNYVDMTYNWVGSITDNDQPLSWPRYSAYDKEGRLLTDTIPQKLKDAVCELAVASLSNDLTQITLASQANVKRKKVDKLEVEYQDSGNATYNRYDIADRLLSGLYTRKNGAGSGSGVTYR